MKAAGCFGVAWWRRKASKPDHMKANKNIHRTPTEAKGANGNIVVRIPLANGGGAIVSKEAFDKLKADGVSLSWTFNYNGQRTSGYVRTCCPAATGSLITLSRLITGAGRGEVVRYRDGNNRNLLESNLYLSSGRAKRCDAVLVSIAATMADEGLMEAAQ